MEGGSAPTSSCQITCPDQPHQGYHRSGLKIGKNCIDKVKNAMLLKSAYADPSSRVELPGVTPPRTTSRDPTVTWLGGVNDPQPNPRSNLHSPPKANQLTSTNTPNCHHQSTCTHTCSTPRVRALALTHPHITTLTGEDKTTLQVDPKPPSLLWERD